MAVQAEAAVAKSDSTITKEKMRFMYADVSIKILQNGGFGGGGRRKDGRTYGNKFDHQTNLYGGRYCLQMRCAMYWLPERYSRMYMPVGSSAA